MSRHFPQNESAGAPFTITVVSPGNSSGPRTTTVTGWPSGWTSFPLFATAIRSGAIVAAYEITAQSGGSLTISGVADGYSDAAMQAGDTLEVRPMAGHLNELWTQIATLATLASPTFTGTPAAPTATAGTNTTQIATTAFVLGQGFLTSNAVASVFGRIGIVVATSGDYSVGQITGAAPLASPTFTGTPAAPTSPTATNTTQIATTAFVQANLAAYATLASPTFSGTPAAPTAPTPTSTTQIATTAFVQANLASYAPLASPTFTGTPAAPTAPTPTSTTQLATTAFVQANITALSLGSMSQQTASAVAITGGTIDGTTIGGTTPVSAQGYRPSNAQSGTTYTFVLTDDGKLVTGSASGATTFTIPPHSSVAFPVNAEIDLAQLGAGQITIAAGAGVTLNSFNSLVALAGQFAAGTLKQTATNVWLLVGNLA